MGRVATPGLGRRQSGHEEAADQGQRKH